MFQALKQADQHCADQYSGDSNQTYTQEEILNADWEKIYMFDHILHFGASLGSLKLARKRLLRILTLSNKISDSENKVKEVKNGE